MKNIKGENLHVSPAQNGYIVSYSYNRLTNPNAEESYNKYTYSDEKSVFTNWDDVVDFIKTKQLTVPAVETDEMD